MRALTFTTVFLVSALLMAAGCDDGGNTSTVQDLGPFPASSVNACDGSTVDLMSVFAAHDVTYITMGAKWCTACREEVPLINNDVLPEIDTARAKVIQLLLENNPGEPPSSSLCEGWVTEYGPSFDIYSDNDQSVVNTFYNGAVPGSLPEHIIVDRNGNIVYQLLGPLPKDMGAIINDWLP